MSSGRTNNFDFIRLVAASMVVLGHSFILVGARPHGLVGHSISTVGVLVFFSLSGYLITKSWQDDPNICRFLFRRVRRIFPALIAVVLISVFVLGALLTSLDFLDYVVHPNTVRYLGNIVLYISYNLPLVFEANIYPHAFNGSLWTLPVEVGMYALTPLLVLLGRGRWPLLAALVLAIWLGFHALVGRPTPVVFAGTEFWSAAMLAPYFVTGAVIARFRMERWLNAYIGIAGLLALNFAPIDYGTREVLLCLALPYSVLAVGLRSWPLLRSAGRFGDPSYGIYLWSFPVQQLTVHFIGSAGGRWGNFAIGMPVSLVLGLLSWHLIEKYALRVKVPSRLIFARSRSSPTIPIRG